MLLAHSPHGCNVQSWASPKIGTRSIFWVSYMGERAQGLGPSSLLLYQAISRALDQKVKQPGLKLMALWDAGTTDVGTQCLSTSPQMS